MFAYREWVDRMASRHLLLLFSHSVMSDSVAPGTAACQTPLSFTVSWSLLKFMRIEPGMLSKQITLCRLFLPLPSISPSIRVFFQWVGFLHGQSRSFSFSNCTSNEYSRLISFRIDWFDLLAVQELSVFSRTGIWKHQLFGAQPSLWPNSHIQTWLLENHSFDNTPLLAKCTQYRSV